MAIESGRGGPNPRDLPKRGLDMPNTGSLGEGRSHRGIRGIPQKGITSSEGIPTTQSPLTRETPFGQGRVSREGNVDVPQMSAGEGGEKGGPQEEPKSSQEPASEKPSIPSGETPHVIPPVGRETASKENSIDVPDAGKQQIETRQKVEEDSGERVIQAFRGDEEVGYLNYDVEDDTVVVNMVESGVEGQGVARQLIRRMVDTVGPDVEVESVLHHEETRQRIQELPEYQQALAEGHSVEITDEEIISDLPLVKVFKSGGVNIDTVTIAYDENDPERPYRVLVSGKTAPEGVAESPVSSEQPEGSSKDEAVDDVRETLREQGVPESLLELLNEKGVVRDYADTFRDSAARVGDPKSTVTQLGDAAKEAAEEVPYYSDYIADVVRQQLESEGLTGEELDRRTDEISDILAGDAVPAAEKLDEAVDAYVNLAGSDNPMDITRALSGGAKTIEEVFGARDEGDEVSGVEEVAEEEVEAPERVTTVITQKPEQSATVERSIPREVQRLQAISELEEHIAGEPPKDPEEYEEYRKRMEQAGKVVRGEVREIDPIIAEPHDTEREGSLFEPGALGQPREVAEPEQTREIESPEKEEGDPPAPGVSELRMSTGRPEISVAIDRDEVLEFGRGTDVDNETTEVPTPEGQPSIIFDNGDEASSYDDYIHDESAVENPEYPHDYGRDDR